LADHALGVVEEIASDLCGHAPSGLDNAVSNTQQDPSLAGGSAGLALFFSYLAQVQSGQGHEDTAMEQLERAIETGAGMRFAPGLYSGFTGVAWTLEHLRGRLFDGVDEEDPGEEAASALAGLAGLTPWRSDYDLVSGLVGFGVYALERLPRSWGKECLERVVARLAETAEHLPAGITWKTPPELLGDRNAELFLQGNYNLGVAHGVPGVIAFLAQACAAGLAARDILDGTVAWLLAQKLPEGAGSIFPPRVTPGAEPKPTRLAWCYGDLGIAASLLAAARTIGETAWELEALKIARAAAGRPAESSGVVDAGLCHGAAGVAHMMNRIYQATGDLVLRQAALAWLERILEMRSQGEGFGGFTMRVPDESGKLGWRPDAGFLTGSAGVGLALLAALSQVEPEWDRVLLLSGRADVSLLTREKPVLKSILS
jgi:lantibiotic modifying enzyme